MEVGTRDEIVFHNKSHYAEVLNTVDEIIIKTQNKKPSVSSKIMGIPTASCVIPAQ